MIALDTTLATSAALAKARQAQEEEQKQQEKSNLGAEILEGVANGVDVVDLTVSACKAANKAMQPKFTTGGIEAPAKFATGGGEGMGETFETVAACLPDAEAAESADAVAEIAGGAGEAIIDGVGSIIGGLFEGLGSF